MGVVNYDINVNFVLFSEIFCTFLIEQNQVVICIKQSCNISSFTSETTSNRFHETGFSFMKSNTALHSIGCQYKLLNQASHVIISNQLQNFSEIQLTQILSQK